MNINQTFIREFKDALDDRIEQTANILKELGTLQADDPVAVKASAAYSALVAVALDFERKRIDVFQREEA